MRDNKEDLPRRLVGAVRRIGRRVVIDKIRFDAALQGVDPDPAAAPQYVTFPQLSELHPAFSESALRQLIARAEKFAKEVPA